MATRGKTRGRKGGVPKRATRSRRVAVAKAKSAPRAKAARKGATAARTAMAEGPARKRRTTETAPPARSVAPAASRPARKPADASSGRGAEPRPRSTVRAAAAESPVAAELTDEERIESAKYEPRRARPRVFEEERFLFPQTYGVNRLRLLVKDPEWLFAYWDVDPRSLEALRTDLGARASALSQLTLRLFEDRDGGASTFLLPQDARTWYVQTRTAGRAYRAEVGVMLPSGEFRSLARSNSVVTPRGERSSQKAKRSVRYDRSRPAGQGVVPAASDEDVPAADRPWSPPLDAGAAPEEERPRPGDRGGKGAPRGGASDLHRR